MILQKNTQNSGKLQERGIQPLQRLHQRSTYILLGMTLLRCSQNRQDCLTPHVSKDCWVNHVRAQGLFVVSLRHSQKPARSFVAFHCASNVTARGGRPLHPGQKQNKCPLPSCWDLRPSESEKSHFIPCASNISVRRVPLCFWAQGRDRKCPSHCAHARLQDL